ncbi:putative phosphotransacetylase [Thermanaeromonas toyohensis ToBE]|uniref:Phosphate propanoyltransferase n=1 Tax=Thermanaeromonas toyohensis ToBE TaxID=698762 RepID=A0A1W1VD14_9FIRM|nr:phosphate propanoyltransferase [Thermanaeromonas toyohensis]SMB90941.1 putative phosphotransacetylase [Thermanaeromonas toyohensis ToBE]
MLQGLVTQEKLVILITRAVLAELREQKRLIPVGVSARHLHISREHLDILYGPGYQLRPLRPLMAGEFAAEEVVTLVGPNLRTIENVRILGPERKQTQVELARTDAFRLGIDPPVRQSGDLGGSPGLVVVGPKGAVVLKEGAIIANRHIHMTPQDAYLLGLKDNDYVDVQALGERGAILHQVQVRVHPKFRTEMHIDTDDANAVGLRCGDRVKILIQGSDT